MINIGKLAIAILEKKVSDIIGNDAIKELKNPLIEKNLQDNILRAAERAEQRWIAEYADRDICEVVKQMPLAELPSIKNAIRTFYDHPNSNITADVVKDQLLNILGKDYDEIQLNNAVAAYLECLRIELVGIDGMSEKLTTLANFEIARNTGKIADDIREVRQLLLSISANHFPTHQEINFQPSAETFQKTESTKLHLNILNMGHIDHGKTTLLSAITKILSVKNFASFQSVNQINRAREEQARGITINLAFINYETQNRHFTHLDCPGHRDYIKAVYFGALEADIGLMSVDVNNGAMPQTREHLSIARHSNIKHIIVFLNKTDICNDPDILEIVQLEVLDLISLYGFSKDRTTFIQGSALKALECGCAKETCPHCSAILQLINVLDDKTVDNRPINEPFLMWIHDVFSITGKGTVVRGIASRGKIKIGDSIQLLPVKKQLTNGQTVYETLNTVVMDITVASEKNSLGKAGDQIGCLIRGVERSDVHRGQVLISPNTMQACQYFRANIYVASKKEGGRHKPFSSGYKPRFYIGTLGITGEIILPYGQEMAFPEESIYGAEIRLSSKAAMEKGLKFIIRDDDLTVGAGVITDVNST